VFNLLLLLLLLLLRGGHASTALATVLTLIVMPIARCPGLPAPGHHAMCSPIDGHTIARWIPSEEHSFGHIQLQLFKLRDECTGGNPGHRGRRPVRSCMHACQRATRPRVQRPGGFATPNGGMGHVPFPREHQKTHQSIQPGNVILHITYTYIHDTYYIHPTSARHLRKTSEEYYSPPLSSPLSPNKRDQGGFILL
jgi:hypothetical protein